MVRSSKVMAHCRSKSTSGWTWCAGSAARRDSASSWSMETTGAKPPRLRAWSRSHSLAMKRLRATSRKVRNLPFSPRRRLQVILLQQPRKEALRQVLRVVGRAALPPQKGVERIPVGAAERLQRGGRARGARLPRREHDRPMGGDEPGIGGRRRRWAGRTHASSAACNEPAGLYMTGYYQAPAKLATAGAASGKRLERDQLAGAFEGCRASKAGASSTHSKRLAQFRRQPSLAGQGHRGA